MEPTRRAVLVGAGTTLTAAIAGCSGGEAEESPEGTEPEAEGTEETGDGETTTPEPTGAEAFADEQVTLEAGHHESYRVYRDAGFQLAYEFEVTGENIDAFVLTHEQHSRYEAGQVFETAAETMDAGSGAEEIELDSGTYYVVVDHSSAGEASPQSGINQESVDVRVHATAE